MKAAIDSNILIDVLNGIIIGATAALQGLTVVTRNPRDFGANKVRIPYQIDGAGKVIDVLAPPA